MRETTAESYRERVQRVLVHIQGRLDEPLALDELAGVANFSPYHFHRIFRGMVGESVMEHVRRLRLERAAYKLRHTAEPVTTIAFDAGYETHESFTRAFRAMFGEPPSSFRENHRPMAFPAAPSGVHFSAEGAPGGFQPATGGAAPLDVRVVVLGPMRVAFVRHVGPYDQVGPAWSRLMSWAGRKGLLGPGTRPVGIPHDDPEVTPPESLRYDAAIVVAADVQGEGDIGIQDLPQAEYASALHRGPYEKLSETYARICGEWLPSSGRELAAAPGIEFYHNAPFNTAPADLLTTVHLPLAPREE